MRAKYQITTIPHYIRTAKRDSAFWARIDVKGSDECWLWKIETQVTNNGYGTAFYYDIHTSAHRIAFMLSKGEIPAGKQIIHTCVDRYPVGSIVGRRCCNPYHLRPGTEQDNSDDMVRQGRWRRQKSYVGDANPNAKIAGDRLSELFEDAKTMSQRKLAEKYGISKSQVGNILHGVSRSGAVDSLPEDQRDAALAATIKRTKR